jgi:hypothetical protein
MPGPSFPRVVEKILVKDYFDQGYEPKEIADEIADDAEFMNTPTKIRKAIKEFPMGDVQLHLSREQRIERYERKVRREDKESEWVSPARAFLPTTHPLYMTAACIKNRNHQPSPQHEPDDSE